MILLVYPALKNGIETSEMKRIGIKIRLRKEEINFMNICELLESLHVLNESERLYKEYYSVQNHPEQLKDFLKTIDPDFLAENHLIIPDIVDYHSSYFKEDMFFIEDKSQDIMVMKHNCFSPLTPHKHSFFEMLYVLEGSCDHYINDACFHMKPGDICIVSPEIMHQLGVFDESIVINFLIRSSTFEEIFFSLLKGDNILSSFFLNNIYSKKINEYITIDTEQDTELRDLLLDIMLEYIDRPLYYIEIMNSELVTFFAKVLRRYEKNCHLPPFTKKRDVQSYALVHFIRENYRTVTLGDIAGKFHYSDDYASKLIKSATGYTFTQLHTKIRMHKAAGLLKETSINLQDICDDIGYLNPEHFIRMFKKEYHMTPSEYRKKNKH